jgi:membrane protease YdiL (CAAX protease family)
LWFIAIISLGSASLALAGQKKKIAIALLYIVMSAYVGGKYYQSIYIEKRLSKAGPTIDVDRAELMLRLASAVEAIKNKALSSVKAIPLTESVASAPDKKSDLFAEAQKVLNKSALSEQDSSGAWAKLTILEHERKVDYEKSLDHLAQIDTPAAHELAKALQAIYKGPLTNFRAQSLKEVLEKELPAGWYRDHALEALYLKANNKSDLAILQGKLLAGSLSLFFRMGALALFGLIALLVGIIIIFAQLIFLARNPGESDQSDMVKAPVSCGLATVYGVFICWLTVQSMIGTMAQSSMKSISPLLKMSGSMDSNSSKPVLIALTVAVLYLLSNGPGTLFAYLMTLRPSKIGFAEGFRLRLKVATRGPISLIFAGIATWFAAVPLVLIASLIGYKLGSQGSSNPIIALVMEAARSGNPLSTLLFYLTLGVIAPFCEETLFRGFLYANLRRYMGVLPAVVISAGLFAAFHLDLGAFLPLFTLGALFAMVFEKTKSILPSMVAHGLWNSGTFTLLLLLFGG